MARKSVVLVTGAGGEMGHTLIRRLVELPAFDVLALDVRALDPELARCCIDVRVGDVLDRHVLDRLMSEFEISAVFHLAALLSMNLLRLAVEEARSLGRPRTRSRPCSGSCRLPPSR